MLILICLYIKFGLTGNPTILQEVIAAKQLGVENNIKIAKYNVVLQTSGSVPQLTKLRRQFLTYSKMQQIETDQIPSLFIQYLNKSL